MRKYDEAIDLFKKSLSIRERIGDIFGISETIANIGILLHATDKPEKALPYLERSLTLMERCEHPGRNELEARIAQIRRGSNLF